MSLGFGHQDNCSSYLLSLDSTQALHSLYQTSSFSLDMLYHRINFHKHYYAETTGTWVQRQNRCSVHPSSIPRSHLNDASTCSEAWTRHICLKTHSFNPSDNEKGLCGAHNTGRLYSVQQTLQVFSVKCDNQISCPAQLTLKRWSLHLSFSPW